jgi:predicted TIM-barrel fold metal-dependent hydrolase
VSEPATVPHRERPLVVDAHAHVLPHLGGPAGFATAADHLLYAQRAMHTHRAQPVRRARDNEIVTEPTLWDPDDASPRGRREVGFRAGRHGRFEWRRDDEDLYLQFMPPSLQTMEAPPDFMVAQMDYAGIDVAVLQNDHIYGSLNEYFADAIRSHPGRFIGLAQVEEPAAYQDAQIERLHHAVLHLGMRGLYFTTATFFMTGYTIYYDEGDFGPFWDAVAALDLPVFFTFAASPLGDFGAELRRFLGWHERYPDVRTVLVHGLPDAQFLDERGRLRPSDALRNLVGRFAVHAEILFPIKWGGRWDYPYPAARDLVPQYLDLFGPDRLVWGSDMPNVERYCTYRQALTYLTHDPAGLDADTLERILAKNVLALLRPEGEEARAARPA